MSLRPQFAKRTSRPQNHLAAIGRLFPEAWGEVDAIRAKRGKEGQSSWPEWCYLPHACWESIVMKGSNAAALHGRVDAAIQNLATMGTWRVTQGIYRFDPTLFDALTAPGGRRYPDRPNLQLPEWCIYVETPGIAWEAERLHGFFAHLEWSSEKDAPTLQLMLDTDSALKSLSIELNPNSPSRETDASRLSSDASITTSALVSLLNFICGPDAAIGDSARSPQNPTPKRTKEGWRVFPANRTTTWFVRSKSESAFRTT